MDYQPLTMYSGCNLHQYLLSRLRFLLLLVYVTSNFSLLFSYEKLSCIIHLHSNYSHGVNKTLEDLIIEARQKKIDVVIPTDHDIMSWQYTPFELVKIISKKVELNSVLKKGVENYLIDILKLRLKYPDTIVIAGVESSPVYWWSGSLQDKTLTINDWHRHLLIIGLEEPCDYKKIPSVSICPEGKINFFMLWPVVLCLLGLRLFKKNFTGILLIIAGAVILYYNYPFISYTHTPLKPDKTANPYQRCIDYVNSKSALTFWAHPEARNWEKPQKFGGVYVKTKPYPELLKQTKNYTGFAIFPEGYKKVGNIGEMWDKMLLDYCENKTNKPVWAISELDYKENFNAPINILQNILWVKQKSKEEVINTLRNGRFYALWRGEDWELKINDFYFSNGKEKVIFGETLVAGDLPPKLFMDIGTSDQKKRHARIFIIKDGRLLNSIETEIPSKIFYEVSEKIHTKSYVRIFIDAGYPNYIATNPVFLVR